MAKHNSFETATKNLKTAGFEKGKKAVVDFAAEFGKRDIIVEKPGMEK